MKSRRGIEYDLIDALRRNPTTIMAGDDICGKAADEIESAHKLLRCVKFKLMLREQYNGLPDALLSDVERHLANFDESSTDA